MENLKSYNKKKSYITKLHTKIHKIDNNHMIVSYYNHFYVLS